MPTTISEPAIFIPVRLDSKRLPGKPLLEVKGKTLLEYTYDRTGGCSTVKPENRWVVTGDEDILLFCEARGIQTIKTSKYHPNGTSRCIEAYDQLTRQGRSFDVIVNWQGDEPLADPSWVDVMVRLLQKRHCVATLVARSANGVRAAVSNDYCKWFSRAPMLGCMGHCGVYAFPPYAIADLRQIHPTPLSMAEGLEQLAWLENGIVIKAIEMDSLPLNINTPEDWERFEQLVNNGEKATC